MSENNKTNTSEIETTTSKEKKYNFGGIKEYKLEDIEAEVLNDNVYLDVFAGSDIRFKEKVQNFDQALSLLSGLNVYKYNYRNDEFSDKNFPKDEQVGVMAQDLEKVLPHLVKEDENGFRYVNYAGMTPVLLSGIQELISITKKQDDTIQSMQTIIQNLEKKLESK